MSQDEYLKKAGDIWVIAQIEHIDAVANLDRILEVDGINGYIIGMSDLSSSMNILGQLANPELLKVIDEIAVKIKAKGKPFGTAAGFNDRILRQWIKRGGRLISIGGEEEFLCRQSRFVLGEMDKFIREDR
jgi:2-dehydro-3-deoxyglucarate aldolase/4-hydroxy-2-oxoheptanedioate aldolase